MPKFSEQLFDSPYPTEYTIDDQVDAMIFLFKDMERIATGNVKIGEIRRFARESLKGAKIIRNNRTGKRLELG